MKLLLLNIIIALLWMAMWASFQPYTFLAGLIIGYGLLVAYSKTQLDEGYGAKVWQMLSFSIYFLKILVKANLIVAKEIITPGKQMTPRFIRYPVEGMTNLQITSLANSITLTPGTLATDLSDDNKYLYVHCMYAQDREQAIAELDELKERMMENLFR